MALIHTIANVLTVLIIVDAVSSWVPSWRDSQFIAQLRRLTGPIQAPFRRLLPPERLGFDLSPIAAILAIRFLEQILV